MIAIFSFDEETYVWAWWLVGGWKKDLLMCLYRRKPGAELTLTYRFRYYASEDPHDERDVKSTYHATWPADFDVGAAVGVARTICRVTADGFAAEWPLPTAPDFSRTLIDELTVNGGARLASDVLLKHHASHPMTTAKGGSA